MTNEIEYLSAYEEMEFGIAQANARLNENNEFVDDLIASHVNGEFIVSIHGCISTSDRICCCGIDSIP